MIKIERIKLVVVFECPVCDNMVSDTTDKGILPYGGIGCSECGAIFTYIDDKEWHLVDN